MYIPMVGELCGVELEMYGEPVNFVGTIIERTGDIFTMLLEAGAEIKFNVSHVTEFTEIDN